MSFETKSFNVVRKKKLEKSDFSVECNVELAGEIEKILSVSARAQVENQEVLGGEINYAGAIDLRVIFLTSDGEIGTTSAVCPFTSKFENSDIQIGDCARISVNVVNYQIGTFNMGVLKISCQVQQEATLIENRQLSQVQPTDAHICIKEEDVFLQTFVGTTGKTFDVQSEVSIKEPIKKFMFADSQVFVKNVDTEANFVSVSGEIVTKILYLSQNDKFETSYITEDFKEEIEFEGVTPESKIEVFANIKSNQTKFDVEEKDKSLRAVITNPVELQIFAFQEKAECFAKDLYSTTNELQVGAESFDMTKVFNAETFDAKIDGTLVLDENKPRVDKLMFVGECSLNLTNAYIKEQEIFVEGIASTNVVYLNDETNSLNSVLIEVPFVASDKTKIDCEDVSVEASALLYDVDVVVKKGREFFFDGKLKVGVDYACDIVEAVISNVQEGATLPEKDSGLEVYFGSEGQTAWDIARDMRVDEDTIYSQNPDVSFPLQKDENLVVFYQKRP